jgi:hypothetical protein
MSSNERSSQSKPRPPLLRPEQGLLTRAEKLNAAHAKILETSAVRSSSPTAYRAWHEATVEARAAFHQMYHESFWRDTRALAAGDTTAIDPTLTFLESDPWCFRSGYIKAELMRYLSRVPLTDRQQQRGEQILLHLVEVGDRREFGYACRLARAIDSATLRAELKHRLNSPDRSSSRRALQMVVSLPAPTLDPGEQQVAVALVTEEGRAQWAALRRDAGRAFDEPSTWNMHRQNWVRRVARALGLDHYAFTDRED